MSDQCQGSTKPGDQCKRSGSAVHANGYCYQHQYQAIEKLMSYLTLFKEEWEASRNQDVNAARGWIQKIERAQREIKEAKQLCESDPECMPNLQSLLIDIEKAVLPFETSVKLPPTLSREEGRALAAEMEHLAETQPVLVGNFSANQHVLHKQVLMDTQRDLNRSMDKVGMAQQHIAQQTAELDQEYKTKFDEMAERQHKLANQMADLKNQAYQYQQELSACQASAAKFRGQGTEQMDILQNRINEMVDHVKKAEAAQAGSKKRVLDLSEQLALAQSKITEIQQEAEAKQRELKKQNDARNQAQEEQKLQLEKQMMELESRLHSMAEVEKTLRAQAAAIEQAREQAELPTSDLVHRYAEQSEHVKKLTIEIADYQKQKMEWDAKIAKIQSDMLNHLETNTHRDRALLKECNENKNRIEAQLIEKNKAWMAIREEADKKMKQQQHYIISLRQQESQTKNKLQRVETERDQLRHDIKLSRQEYESRMKNLNLKLEEKTKLERSNIEHFYQQKIREIEIRRRETEQIIEQEKQRQNLALQSINASRQRMDQETRQFQLEKARFDKMEAEMEKKQTDLALNQARVVEELKHVRDTRAEYKNQIQLWETKYRSSREQYELDSKRWRDEGNKLRESKGLVDRALQQCQLRQENLLSQVAQAQREADKFKADYYQIDAKFRRAQMEFEQTKNKMLKEAAVQEMNVTKCSEELSKASAAHQHMQAQMADMKRIRAELQHNLTSATAQAHTIERLLKDKATADHQQARMQTLLDEAEMNKKTMSIAMQKLEREFNQLRIMNQQLVAEKQMLQQEHDRLYLDQKAAAERTKLRESITENIYKQKMSLLESKSDVDQALMIEDQRKLQQATAALNQIEQDRHNETQRLIQLGRTVVNKKALRKAPRAKVIAPLTNKPNRLLELKQELSQLSTHLTPSCDHILHARRLQFEYQQLERELKHPPPLVPPSSLAPPSPSPLDPEAKSSTKNRMKNPISAPIPYADENRMLPRHLQHRYRIEKSHQGREREREKKSNEKSMVDKCERCHVNRIFERADAWAVCPLCADRKPLATFVLEMKDQDKDDKEEARERKCTNIQRFMYQFERNFPKVPDELLDQLALAYQSIHHHDWNKITTTHSERFLKHMPQFGWWRKATERLTRELIGKPIAEFSNQEITNLLIRFRKLKVAEDFPDMGEAIQRRHLNTHHIVRHLGTPLYPQARLFRTGKNRTSHEQTVRSIECEIEQPETMAPST